MRDHRSVAAVVVAIEDNAMRWLDRCLIEATINPNLHLMCDRKIVFYLDRRLKLTVAAAAAVQWIAFAANDMIVVADESTISMSRGLNHSIRNAMQFLRCQSMFRSTNWNARLNVTSAAEN